MPTYRVTYRLPELNIDQQFMNHSIMSVFSQLHCFYDFKKQEERILHDLRKNGFSSFRDPRKNNNVFTIEVHNNPTA